jgi:hypothetical protein
MNYTTRTNCIICNNKLFNTFFINNKNIPIATYCIQNKSNYINSLIPFNIFKCEKCFTVQTKYLGYLNEIYKYNHADGIGLTMQNLHKIVADIIFKNYYYINNIIEIGSSKGILADIIISKLNNTKYYIIDPSYIGSSHENKIILNDFYENVNDTQLNANTLIISHVFEHFYNPIQILEKINNNNNIKNFLLVWPDLDYYLNNNIYHVLNTEHTFYISNYNLIQLISSYNFKLIEEYNYIGHSKIYYFIKKINSINQQNITYFNNNYIDLYFKKLNNTVLYLNNIINNTHKNIYLWPCSIHSIFLIVFGLNLTKITNFLDNSPLKINKKLYGYDKTCLSFYDFIQKNEDCFIILNGGIFNKEIENNIQNYPNISVLNCSN